MPDISELKKKLETALNIVSDRKSRAYKRIEPLIDRILEILSPSIEFIQKKYEWFRKDILKEDELKNHILIKYLFKDLFLYFLVEYSNPMNCLPSFPLSVLLSYVEMTHFLL